MIVKTTNSRPGTTGSVYQPVAHKFFVLMQQLISFEPQATEHEPMLIYKKNKNFKIVPKKPDAGIMYSLPNQPGKRPFNANDSAKTNWYPQKRQTDTRQQIKVRTRNQKESRKQVAR